MPFRFLEDIATADVAFEAWGDNREELFVAGAEALLSTMVADPREVTRCQEQPIRLEHEELDLLLLLFLQELIFCKDARRLLLHVDLARVDERRGVFHLEALARGEQIDEGRHRLLVDVKAVTLHRLQVLFDGSCWKATVVLDV